MGTRMQTPYAFEWGPGIENRQMKLMFVDILTWYLEVSIQTTKKKIFLIQNLIELNLLFEWQNIIEFINKYT